MLRKFVGYYKNHLGLFILDMSCSVSKAIIDLLTPLVVKIFVDSALPVNDTSLMLKLAIFLIISLVLTVVLNYVVSYYGHVMGTKIERDMRQELYEHFQSMDVKFFTEEQTGKLMSRLVGDLRDISEFSHHGPEDIFISVVMLTGSFIILFTLNVPLTLILLLIVIVMLIFTRSRRNKMSAAFRKTREFHADLNGQIANSLSGISVTKSYTNEEFEKQNFFKSNLAYQDSWSEAYQQMGIFSSVMYFMLKLMIVVVLIIGGYLTLDNQITVGDLATFTLYITYFTGPLNRLISFFDQYQKGWSGYRRFYDMLQVDDEIKSGTRIFEDFENIIEFRNACFSYEDSDILKNFNVKIAKNSNVALVGKTGVGKSTIAKLIPRFYDLTDGELLFDGVNIKEFDLSSLRSNIGYVEQDSYIFFGTILDNILYGNPNASYKEVLEAASLASLDEFVETLPNKYDTVVGEKGIKLSGGQKQRISLARMFLKNPSILVLDEATSALDNKTELLIQKSIEKLSVNRTSIIIAHRLTTIENCDMIYLLDENGIAESGTHKDLMVKQGLYYEMYMSALNKGKTMIS